MSVLCGAVAVVAAALLCYFLAPGRRRQPPPAPLPALPATAAARYPTHSLSQKLDRTGNQLDTARALLDRRGTELHQARNLTAGVEQELLLERGRAAVVSQSLWRVTRERDELRQRADVMEERLAEALALLKSSEDDRALTYDNLQNALAIVASHEEELRKAADELLMVDTMEEQLTALLLENKELRDRDGRFTPGKSRSFSRRKFASMVQGMTSEDLEDYLGQPDQIEEGTPAYYVYQRPLTHSGSRQDAYVKIQVSEGRVTRCLFGQ